MFHPRRSRFRPSAFKPSPGKRANPVPNRGNLLTAHNAFIILSGANRPTSRRGSFFPLFPKLFLSCARAPEMKRRRMNKLTWGWGSINMI
jgi:hypothetical protein